MTMAPETRQLMELIESSYPRGEVIGAAEARRQIAEAVKPMVGTGEPVAEVEDMTVPGPAGDVPVRVYWPSTDPGLPVVAFFHGGGFVIGNCDTHDGTARALANRAGAVLMSVDYRMAPEAPFPAPLDDCYAATQWLAANASSALDADASRLAVAGDSAGGNLAAAVALRARDDASGGPAIAFQLLVYPVVDLSAGRTQHESQRTNGEGYFLTHSSMEWYRSQYLADEADGENPLASPFVAADLSGLPPAYVVTAEFDPLRDEGEAYARRLRDAGVPTTLVRVDGMFHGFFSMPRDVIPEAGQAVDAAGAALRDALSR
jgi:acetyl esterase